VSPPGWREPMLAVLTDDRFSDPAWLYERKLDGVRAIAGRDRGGVTLWSRNHKAMNASYPELAKALAAFLFGSEDALIQLDMSEFQDKHTVSRLVGAPPGYV